VAGVSVTLKIDQLGLKKRTAAFRRALKSGFGIPLHAFGVHMLRSVKQNFLAEGRPEKWTPLSAATMAGRIRRKRGMKILTVSAMLQNSIAFNVGRNKVSIGTNLIYGRIQQKGGMAGRGRKVKIPARPYLLFQDSDIDIGKKMLLDYITGVWRNAA